MRTNFYPQPFYNPMMGIAAAGQGVKALLGIGQMIFGGRALRKANKNRPVYDIPQEYMDNVSLADGIMNMGMPRESYVAQMTGIQRNQNFGLNALNDRRGGLAGVGNLVQQGNDAMMQLNAADATMRNQNRVTGTGMKMNAKYQLGMQKLAKQQWDKFNPFLAKVAQAQGNIGAGMQNFAGGIDGLGMIAMQGGFSSSDKKGQSPQFF